MAGAVPLIDLGPWFEGTPETRKAVGRRVDAACRAMEALATELMRVFALGLDLPERYFDDRIDRHITNFSTIHYPAQAEAPKPGQLRAGAHTDYGSLTILQKDSAPGGLQVLGADGRWIDAPDIPGTFTVNLGDLMQDWTAGRWRSTLHRVINPPAGAGPAGRRLSMPFFHQPNYDAVIEPLPGCAAAGAAGFGRVISGEQVLAKISQHRKDDAMLRAGA